MTKLDSLGMFRFRQACRITTGGSDLERSWSLVAKRFVWPFQIVLSLKSDERLLLLPQVCRRWIRRLLFQRLVHASFRSSMAVLSFQGIWISPYAQFREALQDHKRCQRSHRSNVSTISPVRLCFADADVVVATAGRGVPRGPGGPPSQIMQSCSSEKTISHWAGRPVLRHFTTSAGLANLASSIGTLVHFRKLDREASVDPRKRPPERHLHAIHFAIVGIVDLRRQSAHRRIR